MKRFTVFLLLLVLAFSQPARVQGEGAPPGLTGGSLGTSNAIFTGEETNNYASIGVATVGDVNGDGYADLLIGAYGYGNLTGRAYLFLGGSGGWQLDQELAGADAIYTGETTGSYAGQSVAGAGDVNGDGYADLLIGAPYYNSNTGRAYLVLGSANPGSIILSAADAIYTGEGTNNYAGSVAGAGDVNGDGYADMLIGAFGYSGTGGAYLVLGNASPSSINLSAADAIYTGEGGGNQAGVSVTGAGDVNGDGYTDMLIGAHAYSSNTGRTYLILGSANPGSITLSAANAIYTGEATGNLAGYSVAGAGDVNGDGYADMLIGAFGYSSTNGRAYLLLGSANPSSIALSAADAIYTGEAGDNVGNSVAGAGDVNGDGYTDLLIGAYTYGSGIGCAYLMLGSAGPGSITLSSANAIYTGEETSNRAGARVAGAGDVNGDGYTDLLVGAYGYSSNTGRAYLIFSDYSAANASTDAARYRALLPAGDVAPRAVGDSGVTVDYASGGKGGIYVTRHYRNTCNTEIATNGLLWRVDSERGSSAEATLTFTYNNTQIAGLTEANLKLWYRAQPCQTWTEDSGATLDAAHNRITSSGVTDVHGEYTIAEDQPSPTALHMTDTGVRLAGESPWMVVGLATLAILAAVAHWWQRRTFQDAA